jgi:hypothetical protein
MSHRSCQDCPPRWIASMPVIIFALVAIAIGTTEVGESADVRTIRYYVTAAECQTALLKAETSVDLTRVRLDCQPLKVTK